MGRWFIPMIYVGASAACGLVLPRIERAYLSSYTHDVSASSAQAYLSAAASGMMAITGIVFAMAFVMVQFSAIAYSPRLALWFARDCTVFHALGIFAATFISSLTPNLILSSGSMLAGCGRNFFPLQWRLSSPLLIPDCYHDDEEHIRSVLAFIRPHKNVVDYQLLPHPR